MTTGADRNTLGQRITSITTKDMLRCLDDSNSSLTLDADKVWLSLVYTGNSSGPPSLSVPSTCRLQVRGPGQEVMSLLILNMTSVSDNKLVVHSRMRNRKKYKYDPLGWLAPGVELVMTSNYADVSIQINDVHTPYGLQAQLKAIPKAGDKLEIREVTDNLGFIQTADWTEWTGLRRRVHYTQRKDDYKLYVRKAHTVMLSIVHLNIASDTKCKNHWLALHIKTGNPVSRSLFAKICNAAPLSPAVVVASRVVLRCQKAYDMEFVFRLLFTFHRMAKQPQRLTSPSLWNCSVPFWPDFRLHLICNRHKECVDGKDERECPWTLCDEEDVELSDSCIRLAKHERHLSWVAARDSCGGIHGTLASFSRAKQWLYVSRAFRYFSNGQALVSRIYVGLRVSPAHFPSM